MLQEIATAPALGGGPHVRVFNRTGGVFREFIAFGRRTTSTATASRWATSTSTPSTTLPCPPRFVGAESSWRSSRRPDPFFEPLAAPDPQPLGSNVPSGINIAAGDIDADGDDDLVASPDHNSAVTIR